MNCHVTKKRVQAKSRLSTICFLCEKGFPVTTSRTILQHRGKENDAKQQNSSETVADLDKIVEENKDGYNRRAN